jgi:hypothetical protein
MHAMEVPREGDKPSQDQVTAGYQQIYIVKRKTSDAPRHHEAFFKCGNWCYDGFVDFDFLEGKEMTMADLANVPFALQKHQDELSFLCVADRYEVMRTEWHDISPF